MVDEILLIHGFPDDVRMWDKTVPALADQGYRCIAVTVPNYGKEHHGGHWGYSFDQLNEMFCKVIQEHSKKKKVTLLQHDWGSKNGFHLAMSHPDLITRIAALDVAAEMPSGAGFKIFAWSYQFFNCMLFLMGEPLGTSMLRSMVKGEVTHRPMEEVRASTAYQYYYQYFGKPQLKFVLSPQTCPVFYGYGT